MSTFTLDLQKFAEKAKGDGHAVVREMLEDIATKLVVRSPVGDPKTWKLRATIAENGDLIQHGIPAGYVGGRFRGNWQLGLDSIPSGVIDAVDPSGTATLGTIKASIPAQPAGHTQYFVNNLPYAQRIEDGWSGQAPSGLVALTAMEFQSIVDGAVAKVVK